MLFSGHSRRRSLGAHPKLFTFLGSPLYRFRTLYVWRPLLTAGEVPTRRDRGLRSRIPPGGPQEGGRVSPSVEWTDRTGQTTCGRGRTRLGEGADVLSGSLPVSVARSCCRQSEKGWGGGSTPRHVCQTRTTYVGFAFFYVLRVRWVRLGGSGVLGELENEGL